MDHQLLEKQQLFNVLFTNQLSNYHPSNYWDAPLIIPCNQAHQLPPPNLCATYNPLATQNASAVTCIKRAHMLISCPHTDKKHYAKVQC